MAGDRRESSPYVVKFGQEIDNRVLCSRELDQEDLTKLKDAIANSYYFEMYVEDLPMSGFIGDLVNEDVLAQDLMMSGAEGSTYLFPHLQFTFGMNKNKIVSAKVRTDANKKVDITDVSKPKKVKFTYSVNFVEDPTEWKHRMKKYANSMFSSSSNEIHWLSIINSCVLVLLMIAFLTIIFMRVLKNDFSNYMDIEEEIVEEEEVCHFLIMVMEIKMF